MINEQFKTHRGKFDTDQIQSEEKGKEKRNDEQREREMDRKLILDHIISSS